MSIEQQPGAPNMMPHEKRAILYTTAALVFTAAVCANPVFAIPALGAWTGAVLEFRQVPSMNPPKA